MYQYMCCRTVPTSVQSTAWIKSVSCRLRNINKLKQRLLHIWHGMDQSIVDSIIVKWCGHAEKCHKCI